MSLSNIIITILLLLIAGIILVTIAIFIDVFLQKHFSPITKTFYTEHHWKAEDYFTDPKVIELCRAIEANDLAVMEKLIRSGVKVNTLGRDNMTPLLWALEDVKKVIDTKKNHLKHYERFKLLLENGANPNVVFKSDYGAIGFFVPGSSITHLIAKKPYDEYFRLVMDHGGDHTLLNESGETVLYSVIRSNSNNRIERIKLLLSKGADINFSNIDSGSTILREAITWQRDYRYDLVLFLLENGANYTAYYPGVNYPIGSMKFAHTLLSIEKRDGIIGGKEHKMFSKVVDWLKEHGEDIAVVKAETESNDAAINVKVENITRKYSDSGIGVDGIEIIKLKSSMKINEILRKLAAEKAANPALKFPNYYPDLTDLDKVLLKEEISPDKLFRPK